MNQKKASAWFQLFAAAILLSASACGTNPRSDTEQVGSVSQALSTDDAAVDQLWDIYRNLESGRQQLEVARQSVEPLSLREEIRLRMEAARLELEDGREHIEVARVERTEQAFFDAAFELNEAHTLLDAERVVMALSPISEMVLAQQVLLSLLEPPQELDVPTNVVLRAIPLNLPDFVDHVGGTTVIPFENTVTVDGCQIHNYFSEPFRYNLVSPQEFECPAEISLRAIGVWNGAPIEEWRQSAPPMPLVNEFFDSNNDFVCAYRDPEYRFQLSSASDPACFNERPPVLVLLMDFADTNMDNFLQDAEAQWGDLMFGDQQGQGNHYWNEVFHGKFQMQPVADTQGVAANGVVKVAISEQRPTSGTYQIEDQPWVPEALDLASQFVDFEAYDADLDGELSNRELSVLVIPNLPFLYTSGAGAQANININYAINGTGPVLQRFARTNYTYTSIGVNLHELAHHILDLDHFASPSDHGLMGLGAYAEDPVIEQLGQTGNHSGTRPTHLIGTSRLKAGSVEPSLVTGTTTVQLNSIHTGNYNLVALPVVGGTLYLENRTNEGYDQSIPFCDGDGGGVFMTELLDNSRPLNTVGIEARRDAQSYDQGELDFCDFYSLAGHNGSFSYGGFTFTNFSQAGSTMQLDIIDNNVQPVIDNYKFEWWVNDPNREDYRMRHFERPVSGVDTVLDFADMPDNVGFTTPLGITLQAFYNTGEIRSVNHEATWSTTSDYLDIQLIPLTGTTKTLVNVNLNAEAIPVSTATITVAHSSGTYVLRLENIPNILPPLPPPPLPEFQCTGDCLNAVALGRYQNSGNFDTTAGMWFVVSESINGWQASNVQGRSIFVNGEQVSPGQMPLPDPVGGKYYFEFTAGDFSWASWSFW